MRSARVPLLHSRSCAREKLVMEERTLRLLRMLYVDMVVSTWEPGDVPRVSPDGTCCRKSAPSLAVRFVSKFHRSQLLLQYYFFVPIRLRFCCFVRRVLSRRRSRSRSRSPLSSASSSSGRSRSRSTRSSR